jgi:hypothetical protein
MSLASFALRYCAQKAIKGRTAIGDRVFDSAAVPSNLLKPEDRQPLLVISTDDYRSTPSSDRGHPRDLLTPKTIDLSTELLIGSFVMVKAGDTGTVEFQVPHTDEGLELSINLIERQIARALVDGKTTWSILFMKFATAISEVSSRRGAMSKDGAKFAARLTTYPIDALSDPEFGRQPDEGSPWASLLAAIRSDPDDAPLADLLLAAIVGDELPLADVIRASSGFTPSEFAGVGLAADVDLADDVTVT